MSMQSVASPVNIPVPPNPKALRHIPGNEGWPFIGNTLAVLADPKGQIEKSAAKYGLIYRTHLFGETSVTMLGPEANELVLFDQARMFSSTHGWGPILGLLFPRGLMLLDFEEHRLHRRALSVAFKSGPMKSYLVDLDRGIAARVKQWKARPGEMLVYPAMKQLTLDLAATSFLGADIGPEVDEITRAFIDMVAAAVAPIRRPLPFTQMGRGVAGRKRIVAYFAEQIPIRRARGGGDDLFSQLCQATHENGALLSTQDIIDHMSFLMMAAHDTLTSSLTSFVGELAAHPEWQQQLREEVKGLGIEANDPSSIDNLEKMPLSEMAFKEALRLIGAAGGGGLLYLRQEGRGIGLANKLRAYALQDRGLDTVDANLRLGFSDDERDYAHAAAILRALGIHEVRLLTNNPNKVAALEHEGIKVAERVAHHMPANPHNADYLAVKRAKSGHLP